VRQGIDRWRKKRWTTRTCFYPWRSYI